VVQRTSSSPAQVPDPVSPVAELVRAAIDRERSGRFEGAIRAYEFAVEMAQGIGDRPHHADALRRLAVLHHLRGRSVEAREMVAESAEIARRSRTPALVGAALNALASFQLEAGEIGTARGTYARALTFAGTSPALRAKVEQNLGVAANIQGDHAEALRHYGRAFEAFVAAGDDQGAAEAAHNLGCMARERGRFEEAASSFAMCRELALRVGDARLLGLCALSRAEVHLSLADFPAAREDAESALRTFEELGAAMDKSAACRVLGAVFRETGRPVLAEARLRAAVRLAEESEWVQGRAEAYRELATLHRHRGRNEEAIALLAQALRIFGFLDARLDVEDIAVKMGTYEGIVLHCERVAETAVAIAEALGMGPDAIRGIQLGAYLHDIGKVKVPVELLGKAEPLSPAERATMEAHTLLGEAMLTDVPLPASVRAIVRSHHEKHDGSGYPDGLRGDQIPIEAQIICLADVFDALTTPRVYRSPVGMTAAREELARCRHWWRPDVYEAFRSISHPSAEAFTPVTAAPAPAATR
jgi:putative nucleotidyltransferase with HDIG domain